MLRRTLAAVVAIAITLVGLFSASAYAAAGLSVSVTGTDFLAGNNGNGLWRIAITDTSAGEPVPGPVTAVVTVPAPQLIDTAVASVGWTCTGAGTATATCTIDMDVPAGGALPTLQVPVVLPDGVTGTATVTVDASAGDLTASATGSAPIAPAYVPPVDPTDPAPGVDLSVDAPFTKVTAGKPSTQEIIVRNTGTADSTGPTTVTVALSGARIQSASGSGWTCVKSVPADPASPLTCTNPAGVPAGGVLPTLTATTFPVPSTSTRLRYTIDVSSSDTDVFPRDNSTTSWPLVLNQANLTLLKFAMPTIPTPGSRVNYMLLPRIEPYGAAMSGPMTLVDPLPEGSVFVSAAGTGWTCSLDTSTGSPGTVRCQRPDGSVEPVTVLVDLPPSEFAPGETVTNTATVSSATTELFTDDNSGSVSVVLGAPAVDLRILKRVDYGSAGYIPTFEGDTFSYVLDVANLGPSTSTGTVTVTDVLPEPLSFVSAEGAGWTCAFDAGTRAVTCTSSQVVPNGSGEPAASFPPIKLTVSVPDKITATPPYSGLLVNNVATVESTEPDPYLANNSASVALMVEMRQDIGVVKSAPGPFFQGAGSSTVFPPNAQAVAGAPIWNTWKIDITNYDDRPVQYLSFSDTLPIGVTFTGLYTPPGSPTLPWTCSPYGDPTTVQHGVICYLPSWGPMPANTTHSLYLVTYVDPNTPEGTILENTVTHALAGKDGNAANDTATATAPLQSLRTDLLTTKYGPYPTGDGRLYYSLAATNVGPSRYQGSFVITDILPQYLDVSEVVLSSTANNGAGFNGTCVTSTEPDGRTKVECTITDTLLMEAGQIYQIGVIYVTVQGSTPRQIAGNCLDLGWGTATAPDGSGAHPEWYHYCTEPFYFDASIKTLDLEYTKSVDFPAVPYWDVYEREAGEGHFVRPGDVLTYHLAVKNTGSGTWTGTIPLQDYFYNDVFDDLEVVAVTPQPGAGWTCADPVGFGMTTPTQPTLTCSTDADLPVGETIWVDLMVKSGSARSMYNVVQPNASPWNFDANGFNNVAGIQVFGMPQSDLGIEKSFTAKSIYGFETNIAEGGVIAASETGMWVLKATMNGMMAQTPIVITDTLPPGFKIESILQPGQGYLPFDCVVSGEVALGQTVTCTYDDSEYVYKPGWTGTYTLGYIYLKVSWNLSAGVHTNTATIQATNSRPDGLPKTDSFPVRVAAVDAGIRKVAGTTGSVPLGGLVPYSITVDNRGGDPITDTVTVTDTLPNGLGLVAVEGVGWTCSSDGAVPPVVTCTSESDIGGGMSSTPIVLVAEILTSPMYASNKATVTVPQDEVPENDTAYASAYSSGGRLADDLKVTTMLGGRIMPGAEVTWNVDLANIGPRIVNGTVELTVRVPEGLTPTGTVGDGWTCTIDGQVLVCHNDTDAVPGVPYPRLGVQLLADPELVGTEVFVLTAMLGADGLVDANVSNNQADEIALAQPLPIPSIELVKLTNGIDVFPADPVALTVGDPVTWTYLVTNTGNRILTDIALADDMEGAITCPKTTLAVEESMVCSATGTAIVGTYVNTATVTASGAGPEGPMLVADLDASSYVATPAEVPPTEDDDDDPLPETGSSTILGVLWGLGLTALGALLVGVGRRRRRTC